MKKLSILVFSLFMIVLLSVAVSAVTEPVDVVQIPVKAVTVDGVISDGEWDGATRLTLNISDTSVWTEHGAGIVGTDGWSKLGHTDEDFSTDLAFTVEGKYLYILLTRTDSTLNFATDDFHRPYASDGALMWFYDPEFTIQYGLQLLAADKSGNPIIGYFFTDSDQNSSANLMEDGAAEAVTKVTDNGYIMEARVDMSAMDDFDYNMLAGGAITVTYCAVNICEDGWDSDDGAHALWGTYNYQAQYKGVNDWEYAPTAQLVSADGTPIAPAASDPAADTVADEINDDVVEVRGAYRFYDVEPILDGTNVVDVMSDMNDISGYRGEIGVDLFNLSPGGNGYCVKRDTCVWYDFEAPGDGIYTFMIEYIARTGSERGLDWSLDDPDGTARRYIDLWESDDHAYVVSTFETTKGPHSFYVYAPTDMDDSTLKSCDTFWVTVNYTPDGLAAALASNVIPTETPAEPVVEPETEAPAAEETEAPTAENVIEEAAETVAEAVENAVSEIVSDAAAGVTAEAAKSGCGSFIGGGLIVLVSVLGSAWIARRK